MKLAPKAWQAELDALSAENEVDYKKLKERRAEVAEPQKIHRYVHAALQADASEQIHNKQHELDR